MEQVPGQGGDDQRRRPPAGPEPALIPEVIDGPPPADPRAGPWRDDSDAPVGPFGPFLGDRTYGAGRVRVFGCAPTCLIVSLVVSLLLTLLLNALL